MLVDGEMETGQFHWVIYVSPVWTWKPPHDREPVTREKQLQIITNIREWFRQQGMEIETEERIPLRWDQEPQ